MLIFGIYIILGFIAELIDGCLGMAYGVFLTSCLSTAGIPLVNISSSVHGAEVFITLASGISHLKLGNVNKQLLKNIVIPGMIGGILGAVSLKFFDGEILRPIIAIYLLIMGIRILIRVFKNISEKIKAPKKYYNGLGFIGGYMDAIGGGGWGPIVTSSLIAKGITPRETIGTVNLAEFFVTIVQSMTFFLLIGLAPWKLILCLMIGGIIAAPVAAIICKKINPKPMMIIVATLIIVLNLFNLIKWIMGII